MRAVKPLYDVVIIGAGISGTAAAFRLLEQSVDNIVVLEARDRYGGRIVTNRDTFDEPVDMGPSWIHGVGEGGSGQFIKDIADEMKLKAVDGDGELIYYDINGVIEDRDHARLLAIETIDSLLRYENNNQLKDKSLKDFWASFTQNLTGSNLEKQKSIQIARECELWHGTDWDYQSARYGSVATDDDGDTELIIVEGYDKIYNYVKDNVPDSYFRLNTYVKRIEKVGNNEDQPYIKIYTNENETFFAKYLIITTPIGVLKTNDIEFKPTLPYQIQEVIKLSSLAHLGKVFLEFSEIFWPGSVFQFMILSNYEDAKNQGSPIYVLNLVKFTKKPMLLVLTPPRLTLKLESQPNNAFSILEAQLSTLNTNSWPIPKPVKIKVTNWSSDPLARCSYVAVGVNEDPILNAKIWQQGWENIRFAGEHTVWEAQGCVQGAWNSGLREADYAISKIK